MKILILVLLDTSDFCRVCDFSKAVFCCLAWYSSIQYTVGTAAVRVGGYYDSTPVYCIYCTVYTVYCIYCTVYCSYSMISTAKRFYRIVAKSSTISPSYNYCVCTTVVCIYSIMYYYTVLLYASV